MENKTLNNRFSFAALSTINYNPTQPLPGSSADVETNKTNGKEDLYVKARDGSQSGKDKRNIDQYQNNFQAEYVNEINIINGETGNKELELDIPRTKGLCKNNLNEIQKSSKDVDKHTQISDECYESNQCIVKKFGTENILIEDPHITTNEKPENPIPSILSLPSDKSTVAFNYWEQQQFSNNCQHHYDSGEKTVFDTSYHIVQSGVNIPGIGPLLSRDSSSLKCVYCSYTGSSPKHLVKHYKAHATAYKVCRFCSKAFERPSDLVRHEQRHIRNERLYGNEEIRSSKNADHSMKSGFIKAPVAPKKNVLHCRRCGFATTDQHVLNRHLAKNHRQQVFSCEFCTHKFLSEQAVHNHILDVHVGPGQDITKSRKFLKVWTCSTCETSFTSRRELLVHMTDSHKTGTTETRKTFFPNAVRQSKAEISSNEVSNRNFDYKYNNYVAETDKKLCHNIYSPLKLNHGQLSFDQLSKILSPTLEPIDDPYYLTQQYPTISLPVENPMLNSYNEKGLQQLADSTFHPVFNEKNFPIYTSKDNVFVSGGAKPYQPNSLLQSQRPQHWLPCELCNENFASQSIFDIHQRYVHNIMAARLDTFKSSIITATCLVKAKFMGNNEISLDMDVSDGFAESLEIIDIPEVSRLTDAKQLLEKHSKCIISENADHVLNKDTYIQLQCSDGNDDSSDVSIPGKPENILKASCLHDISQQSHNSRVARVTFPLLTKTADTVSGHKISNREALPENLETNMNQESATKKEESNQITNLFVTNNAASAPVNISCDKWHKISLFDSGKHENDICLEEHCQLDQSSEIKVPKVINESMKHMQFEKAPGSSAEVRSNIHLPKQLPEIRSNKLSFESRLHSPVLGMCNIKFIPDQMTKADETGQEQRDSLKLTPSKSPNVSFYGNTVGVECDPPYINTEATFIPGAKSANNLPGERCQKTPNNKDVNISNNLNISQDKIRKAQIVLPNHSVFDGEISSLHPVLTPTITGVVSLNNAEINPDKVDNPIFDEIKESSEVISNQDQLPVLDEITHINCCTNTITGIQKVIKTKSTGNDDEFFIRSDIIKEYNSDYSCNLSEVRSVAKGSFKFKSASNKSATYKCPKCSYGTNALHKYRQHERAHEHGKYVCKICDKACIKSCDLVRHWVSHGVKTFNGAFRCDSCNFSDHDKEILERHMLCHYYITKKKPWEITNTQPDTYEPKLDGKVWLSRKRHKNLLLENINSNKSPKLVHISSTSKGAKHSQSPKDMSPVKEVCAMCGDSVPRLLMTSHIREMHRKKTDSNNICTRQKSIYYCPKCGLGFSDPREMLNHNFVEHDIRDFETETESYGPKNVDGVFSLPTIAPNEKQNVTNENFENILAEKNKAPLNNVCKPIEHSANVVNDKTEYYTRNNTEVIEIHEIETVEFEDFETSGNFEPPTDHHDKTQSLDLEHGNYGPKHTDRTVYSQRAETIISNPHFKCHRCSVCDKPFPTYYQCQKHVKNEHWLEQSSRRKDEAPLKPKKVQREQSLSTKSTNEEMFIAEFHGANAAEKLLHADYDVTSCSSIEGATIKCTQSDHNKNADEIMHTNKNKKGSNKIITPGNGKRSYCSHENDLALFTANINTEHKPTKSDVNEQVLQQYYASDSFNAPKGNNIPTRSNSDLSVLSNAISLSLGNGAEKL